jgi:hypothetical protein
MGVYMGSRISEILSGYKDSLDSSQDRYESLLESRLEGTEELYNEILHTLIKQYPKLSENPGRRENIKNKIQTFFGSTDLTFAAIDGSSYKRQSQEYMVFFGGSYAVRGTIKFSNDTPITEYEKWSPDQDASMVAYVPIPFAQLGDITGENFAINSDIEATNLLSIHNQLMQLAEVFLIYDLISASTLKPRVILWDQSMSGVLANTDVGIDEINLVGTRFRGREIGKTDLIVAYSHPYSEELNSPSRKEFRLYNRILFEVQKYKKIESRTMQEHLNISQEKLMNEIKTKVASEIISNKLDTDSLIHFEEKTGIFTLNYASKYNDSWDYMRGYFENLCKKLFKDKDVTALLRSIIVNGKQVEYWMTPNDLKFLIGVGLRLIIEESWKSKIMLIGIVKDSYSRYFIRNYLGVMREINQYNFQDRPIMWTDRGALEAIPVIDEHVNAPWSTIEFDSCFTTLAMRYDELHPTPTISGVKGNVVNTEGIILRSLAQFFLSRDKASPLMGHVIFVDRLAFYELDQNNKWKITLSSKELGDVQPLFFKDQSSNNDGQEIVIYLLEILTRNLYPDVIGYPDPLHKADWGAKSIEKKVKHMIESSDSTERRKPLVKTLREIRNKYRRI